MSADMKALPGMGPTAGQAEHACVSRVLELPVARGLGETLAVLLAAHLQAQPGWRGLQSRVRPAPLGQPGEPERLRLQFKVEAGTDLGGMLTGVARALRAACVAWLPAEPPPPPPRPARRGLRDWPIDALGLSLRCELALRRAGIETLGALARLDERGLLALPHLGRRQVAEVVDRLAAHGLRPGDTWPG
ncbi:hypothetical protein KAK06_08235 [Ideonella sp. 4Y11]|uniref:RNA polymerase alpha subunit C-terminal domain-containing protein n=1 Tax=Ideonella aquatica TaxID=2824119 RepID=A0A941BFN3_9BURK|nr:DNA-directed RNA polymerase subunit alpha C-terminal domain-containing protein [Ideonella aquatica]MBQ0958946.1 hypothetical protein [Ideonella aquatica]